MQWFLSTCSYSFSVYCYAIRSLLNWWGLPVFLGNIVQFMVCNCLHLIITHILDTTDGNLIVLYFFPLIHWQKVVFKIVKILPKAVLWKNIKMILFIYIKKKLNFIVLILSYGNETILFLVRPNRVTPVLAWHSYGAL